MDLTKRADNFGIAASDSPNAPAAGDAKAGDAKSNSAASEDSKDAKRLGNQIPIYFTEEHKRKLMELHPSDTRANICCTCRTRRRAKPAAPPVAQKSAGRRGRIGASVTHLLVARRGPSSRKLAKPQVHTLRTRRQVCRLLRAPKRLL